MCAIVLKFKAKRKECLVMFEVLDTVAIKAFWLVGSFICFFLGGKKGPLCLKG